MKNRTLGSLTKIPSNQQKSLNVPAAALVVYPFSAIVAQEEMKLAMILNVIDAKVGGVLIMGHRGTGKSTAVRALGDLLPKIFVVSGCAYRCDPSDVQSSCDECRQTINAGATSRRKKSPVQVVELPLGATEDRICGTIDIEQALRSGNKRFETGLLARANRGFLYIDEVNLLEDHLVDLLLDVSTTGINYVEREGISVRHPARFVLIGSGNPEEGELRPQLLDRFGLYVEVKTEDDLDRRMEIVERCEAFEADRESFLLTFADNQDQLRRRITRARRSFANVTVDRSVLRDIARLCAELNVDGHRGELTITRAARALAAFEGRKKVNDTDVRRVAVMALRHRLRRDALEETASAERIEQAMDKVLGAARGEHAKDGGSGGDDSPSGSRQTIATSRAPLSKGHSGRQNGNARRNLEAEATGKSNAGPTGNIGADKSRPTLSKPISDSFRETKLKLRPSPSNTQAARGSSSRFQSSRHSPTHHSIYNSERGRYARSVNSSNSSGRIALDATLRAAAHSIRRESNPSTTRTQAPDTRHPIPAHALRFKLFKRKHGRLFIFAIDLSGSMALNRISHARDVMFGLLRQSYIHRDSVAIVGFRGLRADLMLPPSKSILRARRVLETLPMGGGTPLSAGLARSLEAAKRGGSTSGEAVLLLFTDGGANVPLQMSETKDRSGRHKLIEGEFKQLGREIRKAGIAAIIVDTQDSFRLTGGAQALAEHLGAHYVHVKSLEPQTQ